MKVETAVKNLREVKDVFDEIRIDFWLDSGTLLGAMRDGKIIEWDYDVDLGTWYGNLTRLISAFSEFRKRGFNVVINRKWASMTVRRFGSGINISLYHKKGDYAWKIWEVHKNERIGNVLKRFVNISNLRTYTKEEELFTRKSKYLSSLLPLILKQFVTDMAWLALHRLGCMVPIVVPKRYFEKLSNTRFYGIEFTIPYDVEGYLEYRYGSDWKTPKQRWVYYKDDGAVAPDWDSLCFET